MADKQGIVQPGVFAVCWCFELRGTFEVESRLAFFVFPVGYYAFVADVDADAVISLDAIDGFQFCAVQRGIGKLVVCSACEDGSLQLWSLEGTACDGNDGASPMLRFSAGLGFV